MQKKIAVATILITMLLIAVAYSVYQASAQKDKVTIVLVVVYTDGDEQRFEQPALSLVPLTITDTSNRKVSSLRLELYATVDYTGVASSWRLQGSMYYYLRKGTTTIYSSSNVPLDQSATTAPPVNQAFVVTSATISASDLESFIPAAHRQSGATYKILFEITSVLFRITFADGTSDSKTLTATVTGTWDFKYVASNVLNSVSVTWQAVPYY